MPKNTDPKQILVGAGQSGSASVGSESLLFTPEGTEYEPDPFLFTLNEDITDLTGRVEIVEGDNRDTRWLTNSERGVFYQIADGGTLEWGGTVENGGSGALTLDTGSLLVVTGETPASTDSRAPLAWYEGSGTRFATIYRHLEVDGGGVDEVFEVKTSFFIFNLEQIKIVIVDGTVAGTDPEVVASNIEVNGATVGQLYTVTFDSAQSHTIQDVIDAINALGGLQAQIGAGNAALPAFEYAETELVGGQDGVFYEISEAELSTFSSTLIEGSTLAIRFNSIADRRTRIEENGNGHLIDSSELVVLGEGELPYNLGTTDSDINFHIIGRVIDDKFVFSNGEVLLKEKPKSNLNGENQILIKHLSPGYLSPLNANDVEYGNVFTVTNFTSRAFDEVSNLEIPGAVQPISHWRTNGIYMFAWSIYGDTTTHLLGIGPQPGLIDIDLGVAGSITGIAISDTLVAVTTSGGVINAYRLSDLGLEWTTNSATLDISFLNIGTDGKDFFVLGDSGLTYSHAKLNGTNGVAIWRQDHGATLWDVSACGDQVVFGGDANGTDQVLIVVDTVTGTVLDSYTAAGATISRRSLCTDPFFIYASVSGGANPGVFVFDWRTLGGSATERVPFRNIANEIFVDDEFLYTNSGGTLFAYPKYLVRSQGQDVATDAENLFKEISVITGAGNVNGFASNGHSLFVASDAGETKVYNTYTGAKIYIKAPLSNINRPVSWSVFPTAWRP